jgi:hypothetical protein
MNTQSGINLDCCVPGQKVKLRDGTVVTYNGLIDENEIYIHNVNEYSYTSNGSFWMEDNRTSLKDVVEILPLESKQSQILTEQIDIVNPDHVTIVPGEQSVVITIKKGKSTITWRIEG